jgi:gamma-glutamylcyclotransferase (GGCT)/AIG2-like uncharacterized protein YtfP
VTIIFIPTGAWNLIFTITELELLFSYGTLQKEKVQLELFGRLLYGSQDFLQRYKLETIEILDEDVLAKSGQQYHLIAVPGSLDDQVKGVAFEMTMEEIFRADEYETEDYKRISVVLESGRESWVYVSHAHDVSTSSA